MCVHSKYLTEEGSLVRNQPMNLLMPTKGYQSNRHVTLYNESHSRTRPVH